MREMIRFLLGTAAVFAIACSADTSPVCQDGLLVDGTCYARDCPDRTCAPDAVCTGGVCVQVACLGKECPQGQACAAGACYPEDCETRSCPGLGEICIDEDCLGASCVGVECGSGERCAAGRCYPVDCETKHCGGYGEVCIDDECIQASCVGVECPPDELCAQGQCYPLECAEECFSPAEVCTERGCESRACVDVVCAPGYVCANGHCLPEDCLTEDCVEGEVCVDGQCAVAACVGVDCPEGERCARGVCFAASCGQTRCPDEQVCYQDRCTDPLCVGVDCGDGICVHGQCTTCPAAACTLDRQCESIECPEGTFLCGYDAELGEPDWSAESAACHDGDACTIDDTCETGVCRGVDMDCGDGLCVDGQCTTCPPSACTLDRQCETFECPNGPYVCGYDAQLGEPAWSAESVACHDGVACTIDDSCQAGICLGEDYCGDFSIVLLPDTQYYTSNQPDDDDNTYYKQTRWIADMREALNIRFVIHLGDITRDNTAAQWAIADRAHDILDAAGVPYSLVPGRNDYLEGGTFFRGTSLYGDYFGPGRFAGMPWYGGSFDSDNLNGYAFFELGPYRFMVVGLEYAPRKRVLCWAEDLIASHPTHRVILVTHCYLSNEGGYSTSHPSTTTGADGASAWQELASRHSNVFLVLSGCHNGSEYAPAQGHNGNPVHQILTDYEAEAPCAGASPADCSDRCQTSNRTGNGWLRRLVFSPSADRITAETLSVEEGNEAVFPGGVPTLFCSALNSQGHDDYSQDPQAADHAFGFDYALTSPVEYARDEGGMQAFNDFEANSVGTGDQNVPRVAMSADGSFVVAWHDDTYPGDGEGNRDVYVRGFEPGGCERFAVQPVNEDLAGDQVDPSVAADSDGNFVVAWNDDTDDDDVRQIYARGFWADGRPRFDAIQVNSVSDGQHRRPAAAMSPDGCFAVAWEDDQDSDQNWQIMLRGFDADGGERFGDRNVSLDTGLDHLQPCPATDWQGRVVVVWEVTDSYTSDVHARGFAADGSEWLPLFTVHSTVVDTQRNPSVGMDAAGNFAVAWADDSDGGPFHIKARGFLADGSLRFDVITVSSMEGGQDIPSLAMAADGRFVVAWNDYDRVDYQIKARGFGADGTEWFSELTANRNPEGGQYHAGAAVNDAGSLVFVWEDDMDGNGSTQILAKGLDGDRL
ncbi:MAG: hypothetical protein JXR96_26020 [Deltaproteobacteria bacterium]|nr:hypothetical protein [Deltaproteobacteria bacterium]